MSALDLMADVAMDQAREALGPAAPAIMATIGHIGAALDSLQRSGWRSREISLVTTKLDEANLWLQRAVLIAMQEKKSAAGKAPS